MRAALATCTGVYLFAWTVSVFAQSPDASSGTPRTTDSPGICEMEYNLGSENVEIFNLEISYIDTRLRLLDINYKGFVAKSLEQGSYVVVLSFDGTCRDILSGFLRKDFRLREKQ
jgi:hypothetical protein